MIASASADALRRRYDSHALDFVSLIAGDSATARTGRRGPPPLTGAERDFRDAVAGPSRARARRADPQRDPQPPVRERDHRTDREAGTADERLGRGEHRHPPAG